MARNKKETIQFTKTIPAGGIDSLTYLIKSEGTIERIFGMFYSGQEGTLHVRPLLELTGQRIEDLVTYPAGANRYMSGENLTFDINIDFDCGNGDQIRVDVENTSTFAYTLNISFEIDYVGGKARVI